jgi:beta-glucosidase-like glycosyl hydrolase
MSAVKAQGEVFATEARSLFNQGGFRGSTFSCPGSLVLWGPTINVNRDPRWGRNGETATEDPWFNGLYGAAYAEGAQYDSSEPDVLKTIVTLKHWGAYSVDLYKNESGSWYRQSFDAQVSSFDMADTYAPVFEGAVRGHSGSAVANGTKYRGALGVMCSCAHAASARYVFLRRSTTSQPCHCLCLPVVVAASEYMRAPTFADNSVNGRPACASKEMQTEMLRGNWSFAGYVVGDSDTVKFIHTGTGHDVHGHNYVDTPAKAVALALEAGTDLESAGGNDAYYRDYVPQMLRNGSLPHALVDLALTRTLSLRFRAGLFDKYDGQAFTKITPAQRGTAEFAKIALDTARQSMTLLMNKEKALPIRPKSSVLLAGPYGSYGSAQGGRGGKLSDEISRVNGAHAVVVKGCSISGDDRSGFAAAVAAVSKTETIVLALGADPSKEHESMDRLEVTLPSIQSELALAVLRAAKTAQPPKRVTLVLFNWGEISTEELIGGLDGLLMAFMPHTATAVAEALFGVVNPSGKLPYTIYPNNYTAQMDFLNMSLTHGMGRGYRYFQGTPLFEFGAGLSYSSFVFSASSTQTAVTSNFGRCAVTAARGDGRYCSTKVYNVLVHNSGPMAGAEVVQLYVSPIASSLKPGGHRAWKAPVPKRKLLDFEKLWLKVGETTAVSFTVNAKKHLQLTDLDGSHQLVPGSYRLTFTNGATQTLHDVFVVKG